jgi:hypothetical protein
MMAPFRTLERCLRQERDSITRRPQRMADQDGGRLRIVAQTVGVGAGVVGVLYLSGSLVLGLRSIIWGVPLETVVGQFPRDFVISVGLSQVVLPSIAGALLYAAYRYLRGNRGTAPKGQRWAQRDRPGRVRLAARAAVAAILLAAPGIVLPIVQESRSTSGLRWDLLFLLVPLALLVLTTLIAIDLRTLLAERFPHRWNDLSVVVLASGIVLGALVPAWINLASALSPPRATLCAQGGEQFGGSFVGQTNEAILLGGRLGHGQRRGLVVIPRQGISRVVIGDRNSNLC